MKPADLEYNPAKVTELQYSSLNIDISAMLKM